jgi:uncharacterized protein YkwD
MAVGGALGEPVAMTRIATRISAVLVAGVLLSALGAVAHPASAADVSVSSAEGEMVRLINTDRARHGLRALRVDVRLTAIARSRSEDMASRDYFSHTQPDGRNVFDLIGSAGIRWYSAGEIIAWNNWPGMVDSARAANTAWLNSPGHRSIILSRTYNYVGIGLALSSDGRKYWTGVFLRGPDRTGGWVRAARPRVLAAPANRRRVTFSWTGGDARLAVLTSGFRSFHVQARIDGGPWVTVRGATTHTRYALTVGRGHTVELRIRVRDRAGNYGGFRTVGART